MTQFLKVKAVLQDMIKFFDEFVDMINAKIEVINQNDMTALEEIMKQEQAYSLKIRGLEKSRESAIQQLGLTPEQFKSIVESPSNEEEEDIVATYKLLKEKLLDYSDASEIVKTQVELKLRSIKILLERLENNQGGSPTKLNSNNTGAEDFKPKKI